MNSIWKSLYTIVVLYSFNLYGMQIASDMVLITSDGIPLSWQVPYLVKYCERVQELQQSVLEILPFNQNTLSTLAFILTEYDKDPQTDTLKRLLGYFLDKTDFSVSEYMIWIHLVGYLKIKILREVLIEFITDIDVKDQRVNDDHMADQVRAFFNIYITDESVAVTDSLPEVVAVQNHPTAVTADHYGAESASTSETHPDQPAALQSDIDTSSRYTSDTATVPLSLAQDTASVSVAEVHDANSVFPRSVSMMGTVLSGPHGDRVIPNDLLKAFARGNSSHEHGLSLPTTRNGQLVRDFFLSSGLGILFPRTAASTFQNRNDESMARTSGRVIGWFLGMALRMLKW